MANLHYAGSTKCLDYAQAARLITRKRWDVLVFGWSGVGCTHFLRHLSSVLPDAQYHRAINDDCEPNTLSEVAGDRVVLLDDFAVNRLLSETLEPSQLVPKRHRFVAATGRRDLITALNDWQMIFISSPSLVLQIASRGKLVVHERFGSRPTEATR